MAADTLFAPTTRTPYTDEWQLGYEIDLGRNMSLETNLIKLEIIADEDTLYPDAEKLLEASRILVDKYDGQVPPRREAQI